MLSTPFIHWRGKSEAIDNQNIQGTQKTKLPKSQWPNEEMGKQIEQNFLKEEV
jgi:hypothetical protein